MGRSKPSHSQFDGTVISLHVSSWKSISWNPCGVCSGFETRMKSHEPLRSITFGSFPRALHEPPAAQKRRAAWTSGNEYMGTWPDLQSSWWSALRYCFAPEKFVLKLLRTVFDVRWPGDFPNLSWTLFQPVSRCFEIVILRKMWGANTCRSGMAWGVSPRSTTEAWFYARQQACWNPLACTDRK